MPVEIWQEIPGFEGLYEASSFGAIRSLDRMKTYSDGRKPYLLRGRVLKLIPDENGYLRVSLSKDGKQKQFLVNRLICLTFYGPPEPSEQACHGDGDPANNRRSNLRWDTQGGNEADKVAHGTSNQGERHGNAKLTEVQVKSIKTLLLAGTPQRKIAAQYGVGQNQISKIKRGVQWSHV